MVPQKISIDRKLYKKRNERITKLKSNDSRKNEIFLITWGSHQRRRHQHQEPKSF